MTLKRTIPFLLVLILLLAACSSTAAETAAPLLQSVENNQTEAVASQPATSHEAVVDAAERVFTWQLNG